MVANRGETHSGCLVPMCLLVYFISRSLHLVDVMSVHDFEMFCCLFCKFTDVVANEFHK